MITHRGAGLIDGTLAAGVPGLFLIEEEYGSALLDAERPFGERFIGQITHPKTGRGRDVGRGPRRPRPTTERRPL